MTSRLDKFIEKYGKAPGITDASALAPDYEERVGAFKEYYASNFNRLRAAEKTIRNLLQLLVSDGSISEPKVDSRLKDRSECLKKFELKYRDKLERAGKQYNIQDHITDLIGFRIVCLYETDIPIVDTFIRANFDILGSTDKTRSLLEEVDSFGYKGLHLDIKLRPDRTGFPEYKGFADLAFEVQIRSIVQDAWSEVDHRLKYKRSIPDALKRRIFRLAALFELADQEFVSIREETQRLELTVSSASPQDAQDLSDDELNSFSFLSIMTDRYPYYTFDSVRIDGFVNELKSMNRGFPLSQLREAIRKYSTWVRQYREFKWEQHFKLNPFTEMRHILYLEDPRTFDQMLWPRQRDEFLKWLANQGTDEGLEEGEDLKTGT